MVFFIILESVCGIGALIFFTISLCKLKFKFLYIGLLFVVIAAGLFLIGDRKQISSLIDDIRITIVRTYPDRVPAQYAREVNEEIQKLSKYQGTIFSWYNKVDLTPLDLSLYPEVVE